MMVLAQAGLHATDCHSRPSKDSKRWPNKKKKTQTLSVVVGGERERRAIEWVESGTIHQGSLLVLYINFITTANYFWFFPMLFILFKGPFY